MEKGTSFIKRSWKYIATAVVALFIGAATGPSPGELDAANKSIKELTTETDTQKSKIDTLTAENKELSTKVKEAEPYFAMAEQERTNKAKEAELKAAELKAQEQAKKEEAERLAAEKVKEEERLAAQKAEEEKRKAEEAAAAELAARSVTLSAGKYVVGRDIDPGLYDAKAASGQGNFSVVGSGEWGDLKVNEMFGVGGGFYNDSFNNVELEDGDEIELNNDLQIHFVPK